jgi:flagellin FlaB
MKANRNILSDNHAQAGIGTLIIFIAMVLVAAVAAAVLISTSGVLQEKAQKTGTEAIAETVSNLVVDTISGERATATDSTLIKYNITVKPSAGSGRIDLNQSTLTIKTKDKLVTLTNDFASNTADGTHFSLSKLRDDDHSFDAASKIYVIDSGDLVMFTIDATAAGIEVSPRSEISFTLTPEVGNPVRIAITTPSSYGINTIVSLYPVES